MTKPKTIIWIMGGRKKECLVNKNKNAKIYSTAMMYDMIDDSIKMMI